MNFKLNKLSVASGRIKSQIADFLEKEDAYNRLRMVLSDTKGQHTKALEYHKSSNWSIEQLTIFVEMTGKLPPDDVKMMPKETLRTLDLALHFSPENIEAMKKIVVDVLGANKAMNSDLKPAVENRDN